MRLILFAFIFFSAIKASAYTDPFTQMQQHFAAIDKQINDARERMRSNQELLKNSSIQAINLSPSFETTEDADKYTVKLTLGNLDENSLDIALEDKFLKVKAERKSESKSGEGLKMAISSYSAFSKSIYLANAGDSSGLDVKTNGDVATIIVPKKKN